MIFISRDGFNVNDIYVYFIVDVSDFLGELIHVVTGSGSISLVSGTELVSEQVDSTEVGSLNLNG